MSRRTGTQSVWSRIGSGVMLVSLVLAGTSAVTATAVATSAAQAGASPAAVQQLPWTVPGPAGYTLGGISCPSVGTCVSVGYSGPADALYADTLSAGTWTEAALPNPETDYAKLTGFSCASSGFCVAVGSLGSSTTPFVETLAGGTWSLSLLPAPGDSQLLGVSCPADGQCVAVGSSGVGPNVTPLIMTLSAGTWIVVNLPFVTPAGLQSVSCDAATSCVAVGIAGNGPLVYTLASAEWTATDLSLPAGQDRAELNAVSCPAVGSCTAGGWADNSSQQETSLVETLASGTWTATTLPGGISFNSISCPAVGTCDGLGLPAGSTSQTDQLESLSSGTWTATSLDVPPDQSVFGVGGISCPAVDDCVVDALDGTSNDGENLLAESLLSGTWSIATIPGFTLPYGRASSVSCPDQSDCVAIGYYLDADASSGLFSETLSDGTWTSRILPSPAGAYTSDLTSVSCPSVSWCLAVGWYENAQTNEVPLAEVLSGGVWSEVALPLSIPTERQPQQFVGALSGVSCPATGQCVAVGQYEAGGPSLDSALVVNFTASSSTTTASAYFPPGGPSAPNLPAFLTGVSCPVVGWCEAVGLANQGGTGLALSGWGQTRSLSESSAVSVVDLKEISCSGVDACVAAGTTTVYQQVGSVTLTDGNWSLNPDSNQTFASLGGYLSCVSVTSCVASEDFNEETSLPYLVLGSSGWSSEQAALAGFVSSGALGEISCDRNGDCTSVGYDVPLSGGEYPIAAELQIPGPSTATSTQISGVPASVTSGRSVQYAATVTPSPDGGDLTFLDSTTGQVLCSAVPLDHGRAVCDTSAGYPGSHQIVAAYSGDAESSSSSASASEGVVAPPCPSGVTHQAAGVPLALASTSADLEGRTCGGYWIVNASGGVTAIGAAKWFGDVSGDPLSSPIVAIEATADGGGYYLVGADGGVFAFGDAEFFGSTGGVQLAQPIVGMATTPTGHGYWLVARDGGVFAFGDAHFFGSTGNVKLDRPVVGIARDQRGNGYWLVASDGGVFGFGAAPFLGSLGGLDLAAPVVGMSPQSGGDGYRLVGSDGGVFDFGDAAYYGSLPADHVVNPGVTAIASTSDGNGYYLINAEGQVFAFGDAPYLGNAQ